MARRGMTASTHSMCVELVRDIYLQIFWIMSAISNTSSKFSEKARANPAVHCR